MKTSRIQISFLVKLGIIGFMLLTGASKCELNSQHEDCNPETISLDSLHSPVGRLVSGENIFVEWSYDEGDSQCQPDIYEIRFHEAEQPNGVVFDHFTEDTSFHANYIFEEGTEYTWRVRGHSIALNGNWSDRARFIILPICPANEMGQIIPIYPVDNSRIQSSSVVFQIDTDLLDCIPPTYRIQVSISETMDNLIFDEYISFLSLQEGIQFDPCQDYYWQIAGSESGGDGPFSDIYHFTIQNEECGADPHATATEDTPCRLGPGNEYDLGRYFLEGESAQIIAKDPTEDWWKIETEGILCWILRANADTEVDADQIQVHLPPETTRSDDPSCEGNLSRTACEKAGGDYIERINPPCVCP